MITLILELLLFKTEPTFSMLLLNDNANVCHDVFESSDKLCACFIEFCLFKNPSGADCSVYTDELSHKAMERE